MSNNQNGLSNTRLYRTYRSMISRCYKKYDNFYEDYGGRGITVCKEWLGKNGFLAFYKWAMENGYQDNLTIERKNVNGNYCPENCCWITMGEQARNKRNNVKIDYNGKEILLVDLAKTLGVCPSAISQRIASGKDATAPKYKWNKEVIRDDGVIYKSIRQAATDNGVHESRVGSVCRGVRKRTAGHSFRFLTQAEAEEALDRMEREG